MPRWSSASPTAARHGPGSPRDAEHVVAFPVWTFAIATGSTWAEAAWGRYWGWDPKETWAFVSWALYACYLHARTTAGWRGKRAAMLACAAWTSMLINVFAVNILVCGLHSDAGL